jgi:hypothetical protein
MGEGGGGDKKTLTDCLRDQSISLALRPTKHTRGSPRDLEADCSSPCGAKVKNMYSFTAMLSVLLHGIVCRCRSMLTERFVVKCLRKQSIIKPKWIWRVI